jgi:hypothetical protein
VSYKLAVWHSERAVSGKEAAELYIKLFEQQKIPIEQHIDVYAFCNELDARYPEIDMVAEEALDACPWSCTHDRSGAHVIVSMLDEKNAEVMPLILELAEKYGLVCFDPQTNQLRLPSHLEPTANTLDRGGTLFIVEMSEGQRAPEYEVGFTDQSSMHGAVKMAQMIGEDKLVSFLAAEIGIDAGAVDSALRELRTRGQALIHEVILSDADRIVLGLV